MNLKFIDEYTWYPPGVEEALNSLQNQRRIDMGSLTRAPKVNKPTKGQKNYLKQGLKSLKKILALAGPTENATPRNWMTPRAVRASWLLSHSRSKYTPHQGAQEKARRVRQRARGWTV